MESLNTLCLLVLFLAIVSIPGSTGLHLGASFDQLNELQYDKMHVKCSGDGKGIRHRMNLMMEIGKVGEPTPLAVFNLGTGTVTTPKNVTAVGHEDKKQIFLTVTIDIPGEEDSGTYICRLLYVDNSYQMQEEKVLSNVTIDNPDTPTVVKYFENRLADLKDTVRFQKEAISELKAKNENLAKYVTTVIAKQKKTTETIAKLETTHKNAAYQCAFMAKYQTEDKLIKSKVLRFRDIVLNLGEAYSNETGVFTAPVDGLYVFHLIVQTKGDMDYIFVNLLVNERDVSRVLARHARGQASTSAVVRLQAGDKVKPLVASYHGINILRNYGHSTFSGFLLQVS